MKRIWTRFKDPDDPFRLVFVCAMWMTGFDVPSCSTIYLDKPMRNHTLMQTIARANRVFPGKASGLIVDYIGVFRNLQKALAIYGTGGAGRAAAGDSPVEDKSVLLAALKAAVEEATALCAERGVVLAAAEGTMGFDRLKVSLEVDVWSTKGRETMNYRFEVMPRGSGSVFPFERLEWRWDPAAEKPYRYIDAHHENVRDSDPAMPGLAAPTWDYNSRELALAQVPPMYAEPEALRSLLVSMQLYSFLDVTKRSVVRTPQLLTPARRPGPNGENLYSALYNLHATDPGTYARIEELLHLGFPGFERLSFPVVGAGQVTMTWEQKGLSPPLYASELSEGTLRFLWLLTTLLSPDTPAVTLIDEPEVSLHPELLKLLAGELQGASLAGQLLVATHSPDLIRWLEPSQVLVTEKEEEGETRFVWADSLDLATWLEEYTLRDLCLMRTLGGRP